MKNIALKSALTLLTLLTLTGCASANSADQKTSPDGQNTNIENSSYTIGDTIYGEDYEITLNGTRTSYQDLLGSAPDNDKFLILDVTVRNNAAEALSVSSLLMFDLLGSDSKKYNISLFADVSNTVDGEVASGSSLRGEVAFDVPELDSYTLEYKNGLLADSVQFVIPNN